MSIDAYYEDGRISISTKSFENIIVTMEAQKALKVVNINRDKLDEMIDRNIKEGYAVLSSAHKIMMGEL